MIGNENNPENVPTKKEVNELIQRINVLEDLLCVGKEVLTLEESALFMSISRSTLYKMTHSSAIPFYRPNGKLIYFEKAELLKWMRQNRNMSEAETKEAAAQKLNELANH